jgi:hypothetical protein
MNNNPFVFYSEYNLPLLLGKKATNIYELLDGIKTIPKESIYYHTHKFLIQHHYLIPEPPNDFAYWVRNIIRQPQLGEIIASINIVEFNNLEDLRCKIIEVIENNDRSGFGINCAEGFEFQFMSCRTFRFKYKYEANNLSEFSEVLKKIDISTLFVNIFDSKLRQGKEKNNFSEWFESIGEKELAEKVSCIDPYTLTLEGLRNKILNYIQLYGTYK